MITLAQVKESRIPKVLNLCPDASELLTYVNEAQERLMSYPDAWWGTWQQARFNISDGYISWPRGVVNIRAAKICSTPMQLRNQWFQFNGPVGQPCWSKNTCYLTMQDFGTSPVFRQIGKTGSKVRAYATNAEDYGKRILVQGISNGVPIQTEDALNPGTVVYGEYLTLAAPFAQTTNSFDKGCLTGVIKDDTLYRTTLFEADYTTTPETLTQIGDYQSDERVPSYRTSEILHFKQLYQAYTKINCTCSVQMDCIVKLGYAPVRNDTDYLCIGNMAALKDAALAVYKNETEGVGAGDALMNSAVQILRKELRNYDGTNPPEIEVDRQGGKTFAYSMRGMS